MKIPKQLKIGAHIVKVREIEMVDDVACSGDTQYVSGEIRINKELAQSRKESTLIHEAMHHINTTLNNNNDSKELKEAFETMKLIDKTICDDRIVYVFDEKYKK